MVSSHLVQDWKGCRNAKMEPEVGDIVANVSKKTSPIDSPYKRHWEEECEGKKKKRIAIAIRRQIANQSKI